VNAIGHLDKFHYLFRSKTFFLSKSEQLKKISYTILYFLVYDNELVHSPQIPVLNVEPLPEIDPLASVILLPVTLPAVMFPDIVALSPVVCATTELMTVNPVTARVATPVRMAMDVR
jgi:hypothetical protein